mgnify:CR=1 FL=1
MPDLSPAQKKYLACVRREKYLIHVSRIFLFLGFLLLKYLPDRDGSILLSSAVRLRSGEHFLRWYRISLCLHISGSR